VTQIFIDWFSFSLGVGSTVLAILAVVGLAIIWQ
jgi:hypothetical protein